MIVNSGDMSIVSDSHTRYGTQGSVSIGEGGPELAKAMLGKYYEIDYPGVIAVLLTGTPKPWVGPMDVALSIIGKVFKNNFVKNKVLEFIGPGRTQPVDGFQKRYRYDDNRVCLSVFCVGDG